MANCQKKIKINRASNYIYHYTSYFNEYYILDVVLFISMLGDMIQVRHACILKSYYYRTLDT